MPRLSLYRPEKSSDYKFMDRTIYEMFQVGGVDVYLHKYIGPTDPSDPNKALGTTTIQDVLFLENRDRKYAADILTIRGHYQVADIDFNLSQFGLFLQSDTVFMTVHINATVDALGRKIISGDVLELPNLREEYTFDPSDPYNFARAIKKYYVVEDINRAAEGFSSTWYPHLYRLKLKPIADTQEFKDILERPENEDNFAGDYDEDRLYYPGEVVRYNGTLYQVKTDGTVPETGTNLVPPDPDAWQLYQENTLRDLLSTYNKEIAINNAVIAEAESDAPLSGYETSHFYTLAVDPVTGKAAVSTVDDTENIATGQQISEISSTPIRDGYTGYLLEDGIPPNGPLSGVTNQFGFGIQFPRSPVVGDTFLRTDYLPNRLFRWDGARWIKQEDNVRMTMTNTDDRQTQLTSFINNKNLSGITRVFDDVFLILSNGDPQFEIDYGTVEFPKYTTTGVVIEDTGIVVSTNLPYDAKFTAEVWLNESSKATNVIVESASGFLRIKILHIIQPDTRIRYSIYDQVVEQRQSLSKALRRIKPEAD
jgi:hypothetical protein